MDWASLVTEPVVVGVTSLITGFYGYLVAKKRIDNQLIVQRQAQLAKEQDKFMERQNEMNDELREELRILKESFLLEQKRNVALEQKLEEWEKKYYALDAEWKAKYQALEEENKGLIIRINELERKYGVKEDGKNDN